MANYISRLGALLTLDDKQFQAAMNRSAKGVEKFSRNLQSISGLIIGAFSIQAIVSFTKESVELASKLEGVERAFKRLNRPGLLSELQSATRGTVSSLELMQGAVKWDNFKLPLEYLSKALAFAKMRSDETGESMDYLFNSVIVGLGRQSIKILDNLGLSAMEINRETNKTGDMFKGVFSLIDRELQKGGGGADTLKTRLEQLQVATLELKASWGKLLMTGEGGGIIAWAKNTVDWYQWAIEKMQREGKSFKNWWNMFWVTGNFSSEAFKQDQFNKERDEIIAQARRDAEKWKTGDELNTPQKQITTLAMLRGELTILKETRETVSVEEIASLNKEIAALEEKIRKYEELGQAIKDNSKQNLKDFEDDMAFGSEFFSSTDIGDEGINSMLDAIGMGEGGTFEEQSQQWQDNLQGMTDALVVWGVEMSNAGDAAEELGNRASTAFEGIGAAMGYAIGEMIEGEKDMGDIVAGLLQSIARIIAGYLAESVAASFAGGASVGGPAAPFTGAAMAGVALSMFAAIVPAFLAEGGVVPGGYPNDSYPAMLTSGEVVAPAHKLESMFGGGSSRVEVVGVIRGEDIHFINQKQASKLNRYR